jgi:hypothetical protein
MQMSNEVIAVLVVIAAVVVAALLYYAKVHRSQRLQNRFGPEYQRAIEESGSKSKAEAKLEKIEKRVSSYKLKPLTNEERSSFTAAWQKNQAYFVDDPKNALIAADQLIQQIMAARGYPVTDFEQCAADISVDHPLVVENYRAGHGVALRSAQGEADTEDLRRAMIHYRSLFNELMNEGTTEAPLVARAAKA